jgi:adenylate cyclase
MAVAPRRSGSADRSLEDLGASVVALDVIFAESDRQEGTAETTDVALAETIREGRVVLGYAMTFDTDPGGPGGCARHPLVSQSSAGATSPWRISYFQATGAICNLPILSHAAKDSGFLNAAPDHDGILRRIPLLLEFEGRVYPSLALSIVSAINGVRADALRVANANTSTLMVGPLNVPLDGQSNLLLRYRGPKRTFPYVSALTCCAVT